MMDLFGTPIVHFFGFEKYHCIVPPMKDEKDNQESQSIGTL
jgi:hypothetical protein